LFSEYPFDDIQRMVLKIFDDIKINRDNPLAIIVLLIYRYGNWVYLKARIPVIYQILWFTYGICWFSALILAGGEISPKCHIGSKFRLGHGGIGVFIHADVIIRDNVIVMHHVTIGGHVTIGNNVLIGTGAVVVGNVTIGDRARIGANAVVLADVPCETTAVGNPAHIIEK
jgi:serine O-acetyltransferase